MGRHRDIQWNETVKTVLNIGVHMKRKVKRKAGPKKRAAVPKNRTRYEGELVKLIGSAKKDVYVSPSGNTRGWDLFIVKRFGKKFIPVEVKTSSTTMNINLAYNPRVKKQYERYDGIWKQHKIVTWYAFRKVSRGATKKEMKWSFIPITNINQMVLSFEDGLTLKEFVKAIV